MIYFDVTKTGRARHRSGLNRVSARLREELAAAATDVVFDHHLRRAADGKPVSLNAADWFLTSELFSEDERPGFADFIAHRSFRAAAIFHDAIPLKHPHITWPQSVARQPGYMKLLAQFDRVWAVSAASRDELRGFWQWQGLAQTPPVDVITLGADFHGRPRSASHPLASPPQLLCVGIIEPRKNQRFLLEVCAELWAEGLAFELHVVGRVNPHFGKPIVARLRQLQRTWRRWLHFHPAADDATVAKLYATARASVFPTMAEGCGLPLLESLWMGTPCVCSALPVLRENADAGGCLCVAREDHAAWKAALRQVVTDDALGRKLAAEATTRPLPTWSDAARTLARALH